MYVSQSISCCIGWHRTCILSPPRGDSFSLSIKATTPAAAACLFKINEVVSPVKLLISILLKTETDLRDLTCSYMIERDSA
jgi:hypothetical protein